MASLGLAVTQQLRRGSPCPGGTFPTAAGWVMTRLSTHTCVCVRVYTPTREGGTSSGGCQGTTREWPCGSRYPGKRGLHAHEQTCVRVRMMAYGPAYGNNVAVPLLPLWLVGTCTPAGVHAQHPHSPGGVCTHVGVQCTRMAHLPSVCALGKLRERVLWGGTRDPDTSAPSLLALVQWAGGEWGAKARGGRWASA